MLCLPRGTIVAAGALSGRGEGIVGDA